MNTPSMKRAFSLVELIVVVVIIGILAAIAIPRFSRGTEGAGSSSVRGNLSVLRNAVELYYYEHGVYPGKNTSGAGGAAGTEAAFKEQLTMYTDVAGDAKSAKDATHTYGPYLRKGIPACPVAPRVGKTSVKMVSGTAVPAYDATAADAGWVFNYDTGDICVNSHEADSSGAFYDSY